ncbi:LCP family protein [Candidatus Falkowbacteria bacterium]|nr:LCP family protein [Candidatus Falkowbacteria bacterium]MBT4433027.1 LCP family protein [Candidatus Falkowbacteria bacterium]
MVIVVSSSLFAWQVFSSYTDNKNLGDQGQETGIISSIKKSIKHLATLGGLTRSSSKELKGEKEDRINILLLGVGGENHNGGNLSDTIIIGSIKPSTKEIALMSVPRDLYVPIEGYGWKKINHASAYGEAKSKGYGGVLAKETINKIFNLPIHYYVKADFNGFQQIVDHMGGVKIYIDNSFSDQEYPDNDFGYEPISFQQGWETMNGSRALKYARSRHGNNNEGSDFARSKRQQKVLAALKEKISDFNFWLNPKKIGQILADMDNHIDTDMESWEIINLAKLTKKIDLKNIKHITLTDGPSGQLYATNINGAYVLLPKGNDFTSLKITANKMFETGAVAGVTIEKEEPTIIEIQNGTKITGLAGKTAQELKQEGFKISKIGNAKNQNYTSTIIYSLTNNKQKELSFLQEKLNAVVSSDIPSNLISTTKKTDFIIILGGEE